MAVALPSGVLTCVFTDIEGSTRMLRTLGARYTAMLEEHDARLRDVWSRTGGVEVKTLGDGFFVVFEDADAAVAAGVAAQRALDRSGPLRVRIGMHTGYARAVNGDYVALVVNQAARVVGAARGGQVLLTADTAGALSTRDVVRPLGRFRVRDFDDPVELYAPTAADLPSAAPRVTPADGHNVVPATTNLVGRDGDVDAVAGLICAGRVSTIAGPGGVGKTRLAAEVAVRVADRWADGAWFVDLAPLSDGAQIPEAIGNAVDAPASPAAERWAQVLDHLGERSLLVVLDNCEHLVEDSARVADDLVARCPGVAVLATSRRPLSLRGEQLHRLEPLARDRAIELFLDRSGGGAQDLDVIAQLCAELDDMPLGIELAAARVTTVPPGELLRRIRHSPSLVRSADPTLPDRHRSLTRLLDYSWELLDPPARTVLGRLSVFAGSFDLNAAEAVGAGGDIDGHDVADHLWSLIDSSLLRPQETEGTTRYRLLATVRAHARDRSDLDDLAGATERLAVALVHRVGPARASRRAWVDAMALELDNARAVAATVADGEAAHALAWAVGHLYDVTDRYVDGIAELERFLGLRGDVCPERVAVLTQLADLLLRTNDAERVERVLAEAEALTRTVGAPDWGAAGTARTRGVLCLRRNDFAGAAEIARAALPEAASWRGRARLYDLLGIAAGSLGDLPASAEAFREELRCAEAGGLDTFVPTIHANLAETYLKLGDEPRTALHQLTALGLARATGQPVLVAFSLMVAARLAVGRARTADAVALQTCADRLLLEAEYALYDEDEDIRAGLLDRAAEVLGRDGYVLARNLGRELGVDAAADLAEALLAEVGSA